MIWDMVELHRIKCAGQSNMDGKTKYEDQGRGIIYG